MSSSPADPATTRETAGPVAGYRTVIEVEVLSTEPIDEVADLAEVAHQITDGDWSETFEVEPGQPLDRSALANALIEQGSDPQSLLYDWDEQDA